MSYFDEEKFQKKLKKRVKKMKKVRFGGGSRNSNGFYFLGFIGSAVYFISQSHGFWDGVLGFLKAIVWPAFLVFDAFTKLNS